MTIKDKTRSNKTFRTFSHHIAASSPGRVLKQKKKKNDENYKRPSMYNIKIKIILGYSNKKKLNLRVEGE